MVTIRHRAFDIDIETAFDAGLCRYHYPYHRKYRRRQAKDPTGSSTSEVLMDKSLESVKKLLKIKCACGRNAIFIDKKQGYCENCIPVVKKKGSGRKSP